MHLIIASQPKATLPRGEIKSLTSLRGIAAMAVVLQHFSTTVQLHCLASIPSLMPHGYIAVDLFFILSGFIMSYTYFGAFERQGLGAFGSFLQRRVARIVPLNIVVLLLIVAAGQVHLLIDNTNNLYHSRNLWFDLPANIMMLQGIGIGSNLNGPSWSISTEFAAYMLFPAFLLLVFNSKARCRLAMIGAVAALLWLAMQMPRLGMAFDGGWQAILRCFAEFALGMGAYRLYATDTLAETLGRDAVAIGLAFYCALYMTLRLDFPAVMGFPLLIVALARNNGIAAAFMENRVFYFLGTVSFSIYLIHDIFRPLELEALVALHPAPLGAVAALAWALLGGLSVIPFAWILFRAIERPGRRFVRHLFA
jgi:peptidoglycan/LPS O-acetylase OafA/YrhL